MRICTIVAKNYLAHARVLADSFLQHNPGGACSVLVIDDFEGYFDPGAESFEVLTPADVGVDDFDLMAGIYDVLELSTAVKPWLLAHLLTRDQRVVYLDPDIEVFDRLDEIDELIGQHRLVLTPHSTEPLPSDGKRPTPTDILVAGAYNLGFIGLGRGADADSLLGWWAERLRKDCRSRPEQGLFVDQRWVDLVPGIVSDHHILRDPGYNVAYWNLPSRRLERQGEGYEVNGRPLRFFHFSGYDPERPRQLSRHQNRIRLGDEPQLRELCDRYAAKLREHGYGEARGWPYNLDRTADGTQLTHEVRDSYRAAVDQGAVRRSIFTAEGAAQFERWLPGSEAGWGVNVIGYLKAEMGVGEAARQVVKALEQRSVPMRTVVVSSAWHREEHSFSSEGGDPDLPVNLVCINADALGELAIDGAFRRQLRAHYSVGLWWWELSSVPARIQPSFDLLDEVWVGSEHIAEALRGVSPIPVHKIVLPVDPPAAAEIDRRRLGFPEGFVFLFVFDYTSIPERKNPLGLIEAFAAAFEPGSGAKLVLKSVNAERYPREHAAVREAAARHADISVIDEYVAAERKNAMIASCDAYVSLHRSEGFGLTTAEAMYFGRPVIATGYSGNLDYMTAENSYLVDYELRPVGEGNDPYPADGVWADPDLEHAAALMRRVFEQPKEAGEQGRRAAADIRAHNSLEVAGEAIERRLQTLRTAPRRSRLLAVDDNDPAVMAARDARVRIVRGPPQKARTRFGGPLRNAMLRLMKPWTVHQREVDLAVVDALEQINVALRDLEPARSSAEGWRSVPAAGDRELETFTHPVAGRVSGYRPEDRAAREEEEGAEEVAGSDGGDQRRRPYLRLLAGHEPLLELAPGAEPAALLVALEQAEVGSQGAILAVDAIERLPYSQLARFLELARSRLRPGGLLLVEAANPHSTEALKEALGDPRRNVPPLPEAMLAICRAAGYPSAFSFHPGGGGDVSADRFRALSYAVVATAPERPDAPAPEPASEKGEQAGTPESAR
jgi:glycosyltransferase involved in cell wall biosynthesis